MAILDPKFDQLPADAQSEFENVDWDRLTPEQQAQVRARRRGLSINDTIAAEANMSVGARGVDFSGVEGGAGAGAGTTYLTPGESGESPAPNVIPGSRGTGSAPRGNWIIQEQPGSNPDLGPNRDEIAVRAHEIWNECGCPHGSHEEHWFQAENEVRQRRLEQIRREQAAQQPTQTRAAAASRRG